MMLIDTSLYIAAVDDNEMEALLGELAQKTFVQSCEIIDREIHDSMEMLRSSGRKQQAEQLGILYDKIHQGSIRESGRIIELAQEYHKNAGLSRKQHKDIDNDFLIVASASVAGVAAIASLNRKTMSSEGMVRVYTLINSKNRHKTPAFATTKETLRQLLKSL